MRSARIFDLFGTLVDIPFVPVLRHLSGGPKP